jgi:uncharacterized protein
MQFTQHLATHLNAIKGYGADFVTVGATELRVSCIVSARELITPWRPTRSAELMPEDLAPIFALNPEVVVLATGARQQFPSAAIRAQFGTRRVGLEVMEIGAASRTYNVLLSEERRVVAAILLGAA